MSPKILVIGATGSTGTDVSRALGAKHIPFRATVRSLEKGESIKKLGPNIELAQVEVWNPDSFAEALKGIEKVFLLTPPGQTASGYKIVDAIKNAGTVKLIVKLSALGAEETDPTQFIWAYEHKQLEDYITSKGIPLTSIRPSSFFSNVLHNDVQSAKTSGVIYKTHNTPMNLISSVDIADVVVKALTEEGHAGKVYTLTGAETPSQEEYAKWIGETIGKEVKLVLITEDDLRKTVSTFLPPQSIDSFMNMMGYFRKGGYNKNYPDLKNVLGREPSSFKDYLAVVTK